MHTFLAWVWGAVGVVLLYVACHRAIEARDFAVEGVSVSGEIVGVNEAGGTGEGFRFHPIVRFSSKDGESITFVDEGAMGAGDAVGQKVDVRYRPRRPQDAHLGRYSPWPAVLFLIGLGGVLVLPAIRIGLSKPPASTSAVAAEVEPSALKARVRRIRPWALGGGVAALVLAGVMDRERGERALKAERGSCTRDADCPATFCDRQFCAPNMGETPHFGAPCQSSTAPATGATRADAAACGPFVCVAERCRSCASGAECQPGAEWAQLCMGPYWGLSLCADHPGDMDP